MRLKEVELVNFCQHGQLKVQFAPGLTAIVGRNGSGKTNLINGIYAGVTGDFGRNEGVKTDNIRQSAPATAPSKTQVILEHGASTLEIMRSLRPASTHLRITAPGSKPQVITKSQEATDAVANILGVSLRILADYVFVNQWSIFDFLSMMPSERAKAFQRLFRTERAEALWKLIGEHHDKIVIPTPGISKDAVIKRLTENREHHELYRRRLEESSAKIVSQSPAEYTTIIDNWKRRQTLEKEVETIEGRLHERDDELRRISTNIDAIREDDEALGDFLTHGRDRYVRGRESLSNWSTYAAVDANRQRLTTRIDTLTDQIKEWPKPTKPDVYIQPLHDDHSEANVTWWAEHDKLEENLRTAQHLVDILKADDPICPTCGTPASSFEHYRNNHMYQLEADKQRFQLMDHQLRVSNEHRRDMDSYERTISDMRRERNQLQEQLDQMVEIPKPSGDQADIAAYVKTYEESERAYRPLHEELMTLRVQQSRKTSAIEQLTQDLKERHDELATIPVTKALADKAREALAEYQNLLNDKFESETQLRGMDNLIRADEMALVQLEEVERTAAAEQAWADYCNEMRHILHRDNLPRLVAQNYLELMQDEINNLLVRFGSVFSVQADESLSFTATFHDGRKIPAGRLSGGEKVLLALAFRVAVNDIFAKDLGLLILDEPTAGLDEGNLGCLRVAIQRLKELSTARGLQVIMITHERELSKLFDHTIELGKEA